MAYQYQRLRLKRQNDDAAVVNAGNYVLYTNRFPSALAIYRNIDFAGNPRVLDNHLDVGATEYKPVGTTVFFK